METLLQNNLKERSCSYIIKTQLDGSTCKVHDEMLRLANVDEWQISKNEESRHLRDAAYAIPPQASDSEPVSDSESEENVPLAKLAKKCRQERESSEDEDDIPLMELRKCLRYREMRQKQNQNTEVKDMEYNDELPSDNSCSLTLVESSDSKDKMDVNEHLRPNPSQMKSVKSEKKRHQEPQSRDSGDVKQLLRLISKCCEMTSSVIHMRQIENKYTSCIAMLIANMMFKGKNIFNLFQINVMLFTFVLGSLIISHAF